MRAVLICCRHADDAEGQRLQRLLRERVRQNGIVVVSDDDVIHEPGDGSQIVESFEALPGLVASCGLCLVVVSPRWQARDVRRRLFDAHDGIRRALAAVLAHDVPVATIVAGDARRLDGDELSPDVRPVMSRAVVMHLDDDRRDIVSFSNNVLESPDYANLMRPGREPFPPLLAPFRPSHDTFAPGPAPVPPAPAPRAPSPPVAAPVPAPAEPAAPNAAVEPVLLGASVPSCVAPGDEFTARLVAYVEREEASVREMLAGLSPRGATHLDLQRCQWATGTIVAVSLAARGLAVEPAVQQFTWDGRRALIEFDVQVPPSMTPVVVVLKFDLAIDGIVVARVRCDVRIGPARDERRSSHVPVKVATSAFASYASADRERVLDRVAAVRISAGLDVFVDCLSLRPGEAWKAALADQIARRDLFLLFWSRDAADSEWVTWEWQTALERKPPDAMQIHPLAADVAPPEPLKHLHFGDVHMMAREHHRRESEG